MPPAFLDVESRLRALHSNLPGQVQANDEGDQIETPVAREGRQRNLRAPG
jgi:hypothetical protein